MSILHQRLVHDSNPDHSFISSLCGALSARHWSIPSHSAVNKLVAPRGIISRPSAAWKLCLTETSASVNVQTYY